mgnify:CR=1 FL=1
MKLSSYFSKNKVQRQLMVIITLTLVIGLGIISVFSIKGNIRDMKRIEEGKIDFLSSAISKGVKVVMVSGNAEIVRDWLAEVRNTPGLKKIRIFRKNGVEAFIDNETVNEVNKYLGSETFPRKAVSESPKKFEEENIQKLFLEVHNLRLDFGKVEFKHVLRGKNIEADKLVNQVLDREENKLDL